MNKKNDFEDAQKAISKIDLEDLESAIDSHDISDQDLNRALLAAVDKSVVEASAPHRLSSDALIGADQVHGFSDKNIQSVLNSANGSDVSKEVLDVIMHHMPKISSDN